MECFYKIKVELTSQFGGFSLVQPYVNFVAQCAKAWILAALRITEKKYLILIYRVFKSTADNENVAAADLTLQLLM